MILSPDPKRQRYYVVLSERVKFQHFLMCKLDNLLLRPNSRLAEVCKHRELAYSWKGQ
jgi:hypothetical protein